MTLTVPVTAERRSYSGSVVRLLAAVALVMTSNGVLLMLWGVRSTQAGFGSTATSVVLACYYVGFLAGSVSARRLMGRLGTSWSFTVMGGIVAGVALLAPLRVSVAFWSALRVLQGFCFAAIYVIVESWFNRATANHVRGRVLGVYLAVVMGAFAVGSLVFARAGTGGPL